MPATKGWLSRFRRFLVFIVLALSFGGFSFYAGAVVPIGTAVLDATAQGFVTRQVTHLLNGLIAVTVGVLGWEYWAERQGRSRWANRGLLLLLGALALTDTVLVALHPALDSLLDTEGFSVREPERFYGLHQWYLWVSTVQWLCLLAVIWLWTADGGKTPLENSPSAS